MVHPEKTRQPGSLSKKSRSSLPSHLNRLSLGRDQNALCLASGLWPFWITLLSRPQSLFLIGRPNILLGMTGLQYLSRQYSLFLVVPTPGKFPILSPHCAAVDGKQSASPSGV